MLRRAAAAILMLSFVFANSADAGWGHWRHCGWGGHGGWGGGAWSGGACGYRSFGVSFGNGGSCWGGPGFGSFSYCRPDYGGWSGGDWGGGYGTPIGLNVFAYRPYGIEYNPAAGYLNYYLPPTSEPAELNFGPQASKQFLGLPRDFALGPLRNADALAAAHAALAARPEPKIVERGVRLSGPEAKHKATRYLAEGDALFRSQNFHAALQRFKLAANAAPDLAEPYWRQGHALVATHNFELASGAFKRAIALTDDLRRGGFRLDDIYAGAAMTKARHLESLAGWALEREDSADPYFLLGLFLTYDGQFNRGEKFFHRAADLAGFAGGHIAVFLGPVQEAVPGIAPGPVAPALPAIAPRAQPVAVGTEI